MKKIRNAALAGALALGMVVMSAPAANAWSGTPASHGAFTRGGYDYAPVLIGANHSQTGATCYGHSDYFKRRVVLCPWCSWTYGWFVHCTQV